MMTVELTVAETGVAMLVGEGLLNKQIAHEVGAAENTVQKQLSRIMDKLEVTNRVQIARWAWEQRFKSPEPEPGRRQRELLMLVLEESAEVQHRIAKALRFGLLEVQPGQSLTNQRRIEQEIGDLNAVVELAQREGLLSGVGLQAAKLAKHAKLKIYLQTEAGDDN